MPRHTTPSLATIEQPTLLRTWLEKNDVSAFAFARLLRVDPKTVIALAAGRQIPTLVLAFKMERATAGAVPASSWLGTELGRMRFNASTFNWTSWLGAKAEATARHDAARRTIKTPYHRRKRGEAPDEDTSPNG